MRIPAPFRWVVRRLLPADVRDELLDELDAGYARARALGRRTAARWLLLELTRTPWLRLRRHAARARWWRRDRRVVGPEMPLDLGRVGGGVRIALRSIIRRPAFALATSLTLIASIGASTLIFSALEGVILRPLPYPDADRLVWVHGTNDGWREAEEELLRESWDTYRISEDMLASWRTGVPGLGEIGGFHAYQARWNDAATPTMLAGAFVLPGFFETLRVDPVLGRYPTREEIDNGAPLVVIGASFWVSRYGSDPEILGRSVDLDGMTLTIVGVAPAGLELPTPSSRWWAPLPADFGDGATNLAVHQGIARLTDGADPAATDLAMDEATTALAGQDAQYAGLGARLEPLRDVVTDDVREGLTMLFWAVVAVILIASINLANLMLVRGSQRGGELAMRAALGASRRDLVGSILTEAAVVCTVGAGLGVLVATRLLEPFQALLSLAAADFPRLDNMTINTRVLAFSVAVTIATVLISGLLPGLIASARSPWTALRTGRAGSGVGTRRTQRGLLFVEASAAMLLLALAGLLTRSALHVVRIDPGFDDDAVAYLQLRPEAERYDAEALADLTRTVEARARTLPGVREVAWAGGMPGLGGADMTLMRPGSSGPEAAALFAIGTVSDDYFRAMGIEVLRGRGFEPTDVADSDPVVIVSEQLGRRLFGDADPVGRTIELGLGTRMEAGRPVARQEVSTRVVGVVEDVRQIALVMEPDPMLYRPRSQASPGAPTLVMRVAGDPAGVLALARDIVTSADPDLLLGDAGLLRDSMRRLMAPLYVRTVLIVALSALAGFLTLVGIYGVVAYVVSDEIRDIGIRMALGAKSFGESSRVVRTTLRPVLVGAVVGLMAAYLSRSFLDNQVFGIGTWDLPTYLGVLGLLTVASAAAAWIPSRRAATVDPATVLND